MYKIKMAVRSLFYRKKQYMPLMSVCAVGIAISILCVFIINGMIFSLQHKAKIYYGGDYMIWGGKQGDISIYDTDKLIEQIRPAFPPNTVIAPRFDYEAWDTSLYFEGASAIPRVIKGIDFNTEKLMSSLKVTSGSVEKIVGTNGILISSLIADKLNVKIGDELLLMIRTDEGYIDTITFTLHGILQDASVFGALTVYADLGFLLNAVGKNQTWANRICIQLPEGYDGDKIANQIQTKLEKIINMAPLLDDKDTLKETIYESLEETLYGLIRLSTNLDDVQVLINAMRAISLFIIAMLMLIIAAGVSSAFRVIVMKRINEIGIYMAIGMRRLEIAALILCETFILILFGSIAGLFLSLILCQIISRINLSFIPGFDIFLVDGVILARFSIKFFALIAIIVSVTTLIAVLFSIRKSVRATPVEALGMTE